MAITSYKAVVGYYNSAGTPNITTAVTGQLSGGWMPVGAPILTDSYGQCTQMMAKTDATPVITTSAYTVVTAANPLPPDATWDAQGEPIWIDTTTYLQAYTKGGAYRQGTIPVSGGGTGATTAAGATTNIGAFAIANNLSEVTDRNATWLNIRPTGALPLAANPVGVLDAATKGSSETYASNLDTLNRTWTQNYASNLDTLNRTWTQNYVFANRTTTVNGLTGGEITGETRVRGGRVKQVTDAPGSVNTGQYINTAGIVTLLRGRGGQGDPEGGLAAFYFQEHVGVTTSAIINLNGFGTDHSWTFQQSGNATSPGSWIPNSDARLKKDKRRISDPLDKMRRMGGYTWTRLDTGLWGIGFIAQEVSNIFPDAVSVSGDRTLQDGTTVEGVLSPDTYGVAAALHHEAILALMDKIDNMQREIDDLKSGK